LATFDAAKVEGSAAPADGEGGVSDASISDILDAGAAPLELAQADDGPRTGAVVQGTFIDAFLGEGGAG
jgi:hypothetical protein